MIVYKIKRKSYIADLYVPEQAIRNVVVLIPGLPKSSNAEKIIKTLLSSGSAILYPNYSGTYDSAGKFDGFQCINDVREFIEWAHQTEVTELYFEKKIGLNSNKDVIVVGMSFGAVISLLSCNIRVNKLILLSPALLFNQSEISETIEFDFKSQMDSLISLLKRAFPFTYRIRSFVSLRKFLYGQTEILYRESIKNMLNNLKIKTLVVHGKLDSSVPWQISKELRKSTNNKLIEWKFLRIGHGTSSYNKRSLDIISNFIKG